MYLLSVMSVRAGKWLDPIIIMDAIQNICVNVFYIYGCQEALLESVGFRLSLEFSSTLGLVSAQ